MSHLVNQLTQRSYGGLEMKLRSSLRPAQIEQIEESPALLRFAKRSFVVSESGETIEKELYSLKRFFEWLGLGPDAALRPGNINWSQKLNDYVEHLLYERKVSTGTARTMVFTVKKFLRANEIQYFDDVVAPTLFLSQKDRLPKKEELKTMLSLVPTREKAFILFAVSSGMRCRTIRKLLFRDIDLTCKIPPVYVRQEIAKNRIANGYATFITPEAKRGFLKYLDERQRLGEEITRDSFLFTNKLCPGRPLSRDWWNGGWGRILRRAHLDMRTTRFHMLHFVTWCKLSGVDPWVTEGLMGLVGGVRQIYFMTGLSDQRSPELLSILRSEYEKAIPALTILTREGKARHIESYDQLFIRKNLMGGRKTKFKYERVYVNDLSSIEERLDAQEREIKKISDAILRIKG